MLFTTADDVHESLGRLLQELATDAELGPRLSRLDTVVQLRCRNPDTKLTLAAKASDAPSVSFGELPEGAATPELVLTMDADVAHMLWLGRQNVVIGIARGAIQTKGESSKIIDLLRMSDDVAPRYAQLLRAAGRADLADADPAAQADVPASEGAAAADARDAEEATAEAADGAGAPDENAESSSGDDAAGEAPAEAASADGAEPAEDAGSTAAAESADADAPSAEEPAG